MTSYAVKDAKVTKTDVGKYGNSEITATLVNENGKEAEVTWLQKPDTALPDDGSMLEGTVTQTEYGLRFKREWKNRPGDGNRDAEITRAVAVKCSTQLTAAQISAGRIKDDDEAIAALARHTEAIVKVILGSGETKAEGKAEVSKPETDDIPF